MQRTRPPSHAHLICINTWLAMDVDVKGLLSKFPELQLTNAGDGKVRDKLVQLYEALGQREGGFRWLGGG